MCIKRYLPALFTILLVLLSCHVHAQLSVTVRLVGVTQHGAPISPPSTSWKARHLRLRSNEAILGAVENFGCMNIPGFAHGAWITPPGPTSQTLVYANGLNLSSWVNLYFENNGWWNDDGDVCGSFGSGQDWWGTGWTGWHWQSIANMAPNEGQEFDLTVAIEGTAEDGTVVSHPYYFFYKVSYNLDNAVENQIVYQTTNGHPISSVCERQFYRLVLPYKRGNNGTGNYYSGGHFYWERKPPGGSWTPVHGGPISSNYIDVVATFPRTEYRARLVSSSTRLGDQNSAASFKSTESNFGLTVFPRSPSGVQYIADYCVGEQPNIEVTDITNATIGGQYRFSLGVVQPDGSELPVPGATQPVVTYTGQSPIATITGFSTGGNYKLNVTAVNTNGQGNPTGDCTRKFDVFVQEVAFPELTVTTSDVRCHGAADGTISIGLNNAALAGPPFLYEILDESGTQVIASQNTADATADFALPVGTYGVRVTNVAGCSGESIGYLLNQPPDLPSMILTRESAVTADDGTVYDVACRNEEALIGVTPSGGVLPDGGAQTYNIRIYDEDDGGALFTSLSGAAADQLHLLHASHFNNRVEIEDANGCVTQQMLTITPPPSAIAINPNLIQLPSSCANTGLIDVSDTAISGGIAPYEIYLNDVLTFTTPPTDALIFEDLAPGIYTIKVIDQLGCVYTETFDLLNTGPGELDFAFINGTPPTCTGYSDGEIRFRIQGGNSNCINDPMPCAADDYWYKVNDGPFLAYEPDPAYDEIILSDLAGGQYEVTIRDADDCEVVVNINIPDPLPVLIANVEIIEPVPCRGGNARVAINTSKREEFDFRYRDVYVDGVFRTRFSADGPIVQFLSPGTHTIQIMEGDLELAFECPSNVYEITIEDPPFLEFNLDNFTDVSCPGATDGSVELSFSGGVKPYAIEIFTSIRTAFTIDNYNANSLTVGNLAAICTSCDEGSYVAEITDRNGCEKLVTFVINEPDPVNINVTSSTSPTNCLANNGTLTISAGGGTPPYEFALNSMNFFSENFFQNAVADNTVYVRDANGCIASLPVQLSPNITPLAVSTPVVLANDYSICGGAAGSASFTVSGFADPLTVQAISCEPDPVLPTITVDPTATPSGETRTITLDNLTAGEHCFIVFDGFGCSEIVSTINIDAPAELTVASLGTSNESCLRESYDGTLTVEASGGMPPYTYYGESQTLTGSGAVTFTNLGAGEQIISVEDNLGCVTGISVEILANTSVAATAAYTNSQGCPGLDFRQDVTLNGVGGQGPFNFSWEDGSTGSFRSELPEGNYRVTVEDVNGCGKEFFVNVEAPAPLTLAVTAITDNTCSGETNGAVELAAADGTGSYQYSINGTDYQAGSSFSGLASGSYTGYARDAMNCETSTTFEILTLNDLAASAIPTDISCAMSNDGMIVVNTTGGTAPFEFALNGDVFQTDNEFTDLGPGTYSVLVRDADNCEQTLPDIVIIEPAPLFSNAFETLSASCGQADGAAEVQVSGGTDPYSYIWDNNPALNTAAVSGLLSGTHIVVVTDANGCTNTETLIIGELPPPAIVDFLITNEACDMADGAAQVIVTSGNPPFTYIWNNDPTLNQATVMNVPAGDYTVVVTDTRGCEASQTVTIGAEPELLITGFNTIGSSCDLDGEAEVLFTGGTPPFTYEWNGDPALNQHILSNAASGAHTILITDARGCTQTATAIIEDLPALNVDSFETIPEACNQQDGEASVVVSGGTPPYSYLWNDDPGLTSATATGLTAGAQEVLITDARGCELLFELSLDATDPIEIETTLIIEEACGQQDGEAGVVVSGGTPPYAYVWDGNAALNTAHLSNVAGGLHEVIVTDSRNCMQVLQIEIPGTTSPEVNHVDLVDEACGQSNGVIGVEIVEGTPPYTYEWSPSVEFEEGDYAYNLPSGVHTLTVTDARGCTVEFYQELYNIQGPVLQQLDVMNGSCGGADGTVSVTVVGGSPPYSYTWSHDPDLSANTAENLAAGDYLIMVEDELGCTLEVPVTIEALEGPVAGLVQAQPSDCGLNNGSLAIGIEQNTGTPPYTYAWSDDPTASSSLRENLPPGDYTVTITDANGCIDIYTAMVEAADGVMISEASTTPSACGQANGSASIVAMGGQEPFTYSWSFNPGFNSSVANNLAPGSYQVTVTDAAGCFDVNTIEIQDAGNIALSIAMVANSNCENGTGLIAVETQGGLAPFSYSWSHDVTASGPVLNGLFAGDYTVSVTDANNCEAIIMQSISFEQGPQLNLDLQTNAICTPDNGGTIALSTIGGTGPFDYQWSHDPTLNTATATDLLPAEYTVTVEDANGCSDLLTVLIGLEEGPVGTVVQQHNSCGDSNNGSLLIGTSGGTGTLLYNWSHDADLNTAVASDLSPGEYTLIISDENGCTSEVNATIAELSAPVLSIQSIQAAACSAANGEANLEVNGGVEPFQFSWSHNPGWNTATANDLTAGVHVVTVTDSNACTDVLEISVEEANDLSLTIGGSTSLCAGASGFLSVNPTGGTTPYTYTWNHDAELNDAQATGIGAGDYSVTVVDANACTQMIAATIESLASPAITLVENTSTACDEANGSINTQASGGVAPYTYSWSHDPIVDGPLASDLAVGLYTLTITDAQGCADIAAFTVQSDDGPVSEAVALAPASCGAANGSAEVSINGGEAPFTINWYPLSDPNTLLGTAEVLDNQFGGDYLVEVTDANGCTNNSIVSIPEIPEMLLYTETSAPQCAGEANAEATVSVISGGTPPFSFAWSTGQTGAQINGLAPGIYNVTATDANGCLLETMAEVSETEILDATISTVIPACASADLATATVMVAGGTAPYTFQWNDPDAQTTATASNLLSGNYEVVITDANGCMHSGTIEIPGFQGLSILPDAVQAPGCDGTTGGSASVLVNGGSGEYTYLWNDPLLQTASTATALIPGTYVVLVEDVNSDCSAALNIEIPEASTVELELLSLVPPTCGSAENGTISILASGGSGEYSYAWDDPDSQTSAIASNLGAGLYTVSVSDDEGCQATQSFLLESENELVAGISSQVGPSCHTTTDGSATVSVFTGGGNYTYQWEDPLNQTTATATDLAPGTYTVLVADDNGCSLVLEAIIPVTPPIEITEDIHLPPLCSESANGTLSVSVMGGTGEYSYAWNDPSGQETAIAANLTGGNYVVTVTDSNACTATSAFTLTAPDPIEIAIQEIIDESCEGDNNGSVVTAASGGTGALNYAWDDPAFQTEATATNLAPGSYHLLVTDENNCQETIEVSVQAAEAFSAEIDNAGAPSCSGFSDGELIVVPVGGTGSYSFMWSDADQQTTAIATGLGAGFYAVTVTDSNNCETSVTGQLVDPAPISLEYATVDILCQDVDNGSITVTATGGTGTLTYQWDDPLSQTTASVGGLAAGTYELVITDENACQLVEEITVDNLAVPLEIISEWIADPSCEGAANGSIEVEVIGGAGSLNFLWSNGATSNEIDAVEAGDYQLSITDDNNCEIVLDYVLTAAASVAIELGAADTMICAGEVLIYDFSNQPGTFNWAGPAGFSSTSASAILEEAGDYTLTYIDSAGCMTNDAVALSFADENFQAFFVAPTYIVAGDTIAILEVSWPVPNNVNWSYDQDSITLLGSSLNEYYFTFPYAGAFDLTLSASLGGCTDWLAKTIEVYPDSASLPTPLPLAQQEIIRFEVSPNPNDGNFAVDVELSSIKDIVLNVFDINGNPQTRWIGQGAASYTPDFSLSLVPGPYVLLLQTPRQRKSIIFTVLD